MSFRRDMSQAIRSTVVFWLLTALIYPFIMIAVGQLMFPVQANGSLIKNAQGQVIGSALIGQPFSSDRYFNSRPSTTDYSTINPHHDQAGILNTGVSGASNLAPSHPDLIKRINGDFRQLQQAQIQPTADRLYTSASGLDPHITPEGAIAQVARIAKIRGFDPHQLKILIAQNTDRRFLGIFGEPGVNVLKLNLALDALQQTRS